jgi:hypothetical protein
MLEIYSLEPAFQVEAWRPERRSSRHGQWTLWAGAEAARGIYRFADYLAGKTLQGYVDPCSGVRLMPFSGAHKSRCGVEI